MNFNNLYITKEETMDCIYKELGYTDRDEYLKSLAEDYDVDYHTVKSVADLLGPNEDFDGLVSAVEDYAFWE